MSFGAGGTNAQSLRYWAAPTAPYTSNLVMIPTTIIDDPSTTYRGFSFGFGDSSGNSEVFDCEVGQTSPSGLWCRVTTWNSSGTYTAQPMPTFSAAATSLAFPPWQTPSVLYAHLKDDSTNIYVGISKDGKNPIWIFSEGRTAHIGTPTRLVYGGVNSGPTYTATVSLVGVLQ